VAATATKAPATPPSTADGPQGVKPVKVMRTDSYTGKINDKYAIDMYVSFADGRASGQYRYVSKKFMLDLNGTFDAKEQTFMLEETTPVSDGKPNTAVTGYFEGRADGDILSGTWYNAQRTKNLSFSATRKAMPDWGFKLTYESNNDAIQVTQIAVVDAQGNTLQTLDGFESQFAPNADIWIYREDLNFDGYPDLGIPEMSGTVNAIYIFWLFDPASSQFMRVQQESLPSYTSIDYVNQELINFVRGSATSYVTTHYGFKDGGFYEKSEETKDYSEDTEEEHSDVDDL
jgi:hypothetical protein